MKPRTLQKVCGGGWWWLRVILVLSFGLSQAEQYPPVRIVECIGSIPRLLFRNNDESKNEIT